MFMDFLDLLFPKICVGCGRWGAYLCKQCQQQIRFFDFSVCPMCDRPTINNQTHKVCRTPFCLDGLVTVAAYREPVSSLIKTIKYEKLRDASNQVYSLFENHWPSHVPKFDLLLPIPLHPNRLRERGFNQAELFAKAIGKFLKVQVEGNILIKIRETVPQASLKKQQRKENQEIQQCFVCLYKKKVLDKKIGLVDDVATTRTTLQSACRVLKKSGASQVWGITLAHAF